MIVAGVMSGTSADGINVALVRVDERLTRQVRGRQRELHFKLLAHAEYPYPKEVRKTGLAAMNALNTSVAGLARLNFLLAELYADAVIATERRYRLKADLAGCHGQTLYHQGEATSFLGRKLAVTWQTGESAVLAARLGVPVVSDFRPADMAAGGKGAPLVPFLDCLLYRDRRIGRVVQNIGGIANLTAIPAGAAPNQVLAFDTGPGNMVIDALAERFFHVPYDRDGEIAAAGTVLENVVQRFLRHSFFDRRPPKTAGREEFGSSFVQEFTRACGAGQKRDLIATATALTAYSITDALERFVLRSSHSYREFIVAGGGASNPTLIAMLSNRLKPLGLELRCSEELGMPAQAKEAAAFALLAYQTWNRRPSNIPAATGAKREAILGKISYA
jgi:anhydro-N-acetylmuramic acid kinase